MNPNRELYGRIVINGESKSLGFANIDDLLFRIRNTYHNFKSGNGRCDIHIRVSNNPIDENSEQSELGKLEAEFHNFVASQNDPAEILHNDPDVTRAQVEAAISSTEWADYSFYATQPDKRIGVDNEEIKRVRAAWSDTYPDVAHHISPWVE